MTLGVISYPLQVQKLLPSEDIILSGTEDIITIPRLVSIMYPAVITILRSVGLLMLMV